MLESIDVGGRTVTISSGDRSRLDRDEVLITVLDPEGGKGIAARALAVIDAPPQKVWPVVRDADRFSEFMPRTKSSRVISDGPEGKVVRLEVEMAFPLKNLISEVLSVATEQEGRFARRWKLVSGTYNRNNGEWVVAAWGTGRTLLGYWLDAEPKVPIPDLVLRKAQTGSLPDVFKSLRKRVKQLG